MLGRDSFCLPCSEEGHQECPRDAECPAGGGAGNGRRWESSARIICLLLLSFEAQTLLSGDFCVQTSCILILENRGDPAENPLPVLFQIVRAKIRFSIFDFNNLS